MAIFLRKDGVLSIGNKTPVTILQETMNRKGVIPNYELIYNGVGCADTIFKYQVSALGFTAIGDGKTKKAAKHDAAATLLRKMHIGNSEAVEGVSAQPTDDIDIASPYTGSLKENYIGMLEDICALNKIPFPVFQSISELGPPHARIFTMECKLSRCTEVAVARTKKQAKHMAAKEMLQRVTDIMADKLIPIVEKIVDYDNPEGPSNLKDIEDGNFRHDMSTPLADMHNVFHLKREELRAPEEYFELYKEPLANFEKLEKPKEYLENLVRKLEGICKTRVVSKNVQKGAIPELNSATISDDKFEDELKNNTLKQPVESSSNADIEPLFKNMCISNNSFDAGLDQTTLEELDEFELDLVKLSSDADFERFLREADLTDFVDDVLGQPPVKTSSCDDFECFTKSTENGTNNVDEDLGQPTPEEYGELQDILMEFVKESSGAETDDNQILVFLTVICPQGEFVFSAMASDEETAEKKAAIEALKWLRVMSLPMGSNKAQKAQ